MVFEKSICECSWRPRMNICFFHRRFTIISTKCLHSNISAPKNQQGLSLEFSRPHKGCKIPLHIPTRVARILPFDFPPRHLWVFTYIGGFPSRSPRHGAGSRVDPRPGQALSSDFLLLELEECPHWSHRLATPANDLRAQARKPVFLWPSSCRPGLPLRASCCLLSCFILEGASKIFRLAWLLTIRRRVGLDDLGHHNQKYSVLILSRYSLHLKRTKGTDINFRSSHHYKSFF